MDVKHAHHPIWPKPNKWGRAGVSSPVNRSAYTISLILLFGPQSLKSLLFTFWPTKSKIFIINITGKVCQLFYNISCFSLLL